jgi:DNA-binding MarR family transcriptional regulator
MLQAEQDQLQRLGSREVDFSAALVTSSLFRAATAVRNHLERKVLSAHDLSWSAFVVLWVIWVWNEIETREIADEVGFSKATLTGVLNTLEKRGLVIRTRSSIDRRLVVVKLSSKGRKLTEQVLPIINKQEQFVASVLDSQTQKITTDALARLTAQANVGSS